MKYYDKVPQNFLLMRFVVSRFCNFRCPYCYVPKEKIKNRKTMFSHHSPDEWLKSLEVFDDRYLELYFTGGEPTLFDDFLYFLGEMVNMENVHSVRIDSNLARVDSLVKNVRSSKVKILASFHPSQISKEKFFAKAAKLRDLDMIGLINIVASKENMSILNTSPHELTKELEDAGYFLNVAKDFHRGLKYGYNKIYREYIDKLQHPIDNEYMNFRDHNRGMLCGSGKHYVFFNRHGNIYSCGNKFHGNLFKRDFKLPESLSVCSLSKCPSIISYSFSTSNSFSPLEHLADYVKRNRECRKGLDEEYLNCLWNLIQKTDLMPKVPKMAFAVDTILKLKRKMNPTISD